MATSHRVYSDLLSIANFVTQTAVANGKNLLIDALREYFKDDSFYKYETDGFGFALTPDLTDLPPDIQEERTSRIYIGDIFRYDTRYFPSIVIRHSSGRYHPISFNQNHFTTKYRLDLVLDGYDNRSYVHVPTHHVVAGAWDQNFEILIAAESIPDREELSDIVSSFIIGKARQELYEAGLFIKSVSMGAETEEDFANDKIYKQSITVETFSEWRRNIPIGNNIVDTINFCFKYGIFGETTSDDNIIVDVNDG